MGTTKQKKASDVKKDAMKELSGLHYDIIKMWLHAK